jgi:hypothetical protein
MEALPPLAPGAIPATVRAEGPDAVAGFRAALGFERILLDELLSEAMPTHEGGDPREAGMPGTLADAIVSEGGAGMATGLYGAFAAGR